jgi:hypothetical protein
MPQAAIKVGKHTLCESKLGEQRFKIHAVVQQHRWRAADFTMHASKSHRLHNTSACGAGKTPKLTSGKYALKTSVFRLPTCPPSKSTCRIALSSACKQQVKFAKLHLVISKH